MCAWVCSLAASAERSFSRESCARNAPGRLICLVQLTRLSLCLGSALRELLCGTRLQRGG